MEVHQAKSCLIAAMSVFLVMDSAIIATRVYVRAFMIKAFGWDDAALCLSYVSLPAVFTPFKLLHKYGSDALLQVGFVIGCIMGFTAIHFGYAYEGPPASWPNYDENKAQTVSHHHSPAKHETHTLTCPTVPVRQPASPVPHLRHRQARRGPGPVAPGHQQALQDHPRGVNRRRPRMDLHDHPLLVLAVHEQRVHQLREQRDVHQDGPVPHGVQHLHRLLLRPPAHPDRAEGQDEYPDQGGGVYPTGAGHVRKRRNYRQASDNRTPLERGKERARNTALSTAYMGRRRVGARDLLRLGSSTTPLAPT